MRTLSRAPLALLTLAVPTLSLANTQTEIAALQPGEWYEITDVSFVDVWCRSDHADCWDGWNPQPGGPYAYSGGAYDSNANRHLIWGGGHYDWGGNEIYAFNFDVNGDVDDYQWQRLTTPATRAQIEACDEQVEDCDGYYAPRQPEARHTRGNLAFDPTQNRLYSSVSMSLYCNCSGESEANFDAYDFDDALWTDRGDLPDNPLGTVHNQTVVDPDSGDVWIVGLDSYADDLYQFDVDHAGGSWRLRSANLGFAGNHVPQLYSAAFDFHSEVLLVIGRGHFLSIDLADPALPSITSTYTGDTTLPDVSVNPGPNIQFDPNTGLFVGWYTDQADNSDVYLIHPVHNHAIRLDAAPTSTIVPLSNNHGGGLEGRVQVIFNNPEPLLHVTYIEDGYRQYVYKLSRSQRDTDVPTVVAFDTMSSSGGRTIAVNSFRGTDPTSMVVGYQITESADPPLPFTDRWQSSPPSSYSLPSAGSWVLYAWVHDLYGNLSQPATASVTTGEGDGITADGGGGSGDGDGAETPDGRADSGDHEDESDAHYDGGGDSTSGDGMGADPVMLGDDSLASESAGRSRLVSGCSCSKAGVVPFFVGLVALCPVWRRRSCCPKGL
ncbi:hypothetical protein ACFL6C_02925 [Myxococcota bacterium]